MAIPAEAIMAIAEVTATVVMVTTAVIPPAADTVTEAQDMLLLASEAAVAVAFTAVVGVVPMAAAEAVTAKRT
jgi:hypothetical protein